VQLHLRDDFRRAWPDPFAAVQAVQGEVYRAKEGRTTQRFLFEGEPYFLKLHRGVGWGEIFKNLLQLRAPVVGARNEWRAIELLHRLDVGTMTAVAYGARGLNPATQLSFLVTEELQQMVSLEDFCRPWPQQPPPLRQRRLLVREVARLARTMHGNGMNHRDFYLCHLLMRDDWDGAAAPRLYLIDLHRAQIHRRTPRRWVIKDLASLYFSAADVGLSQRDVLRFLSAYGGRPLRETLGDAGLWRRVMARARQLYRRDFGRDPHFPMS